MIIDEIKQQISFQGGADFEGYQAQMFIEILSRISGESRNMIELGSNDCYYSILFAKFFEGYKSRKNICLEVSDNLLELGLSNVVKLGLDNFFFKHSRVGNLDEHYFANVGSSELWGNLASETTKIKRLFNEFGIEEASVIHMDIQGSEIHVLKEIVEDDIPVQFLFVSTHPESLFGATHQICLDLLKDFEIIFQSPTDGGYGDGLIICKKKS